jgi:hypothetical protein
MCVAFLTYTVLFALYARHVKTHLTSLVTSRSGSSLLRSLNIITCRHIGPVNSARCDSSVIYITSSVLHREQPFECGCYRASTLEGIGLTSYVCERKEDTCAHLSRNVGFYWYAV